MNVLGERVIGHQCTWQVSAAGSVRFALFIYARPYDHQRRLGCAFCVASVCYSYYFDARSCLTSLLDLWKSPFQFLYLERAGLAFPASIGSVGWIGPHLAPKELGDLLRLGLTHLILL